MRNKLFWALFCLMVCAGVKAQSVRGKLVDEEGQPLGFANVVALSLPDSAFVAGTISQNDGTFALDLQAQAQLLRFTSIGYETRYERSQADMGTIRMQPATQLLGEVVVRGNLPKTQMKGDAMITGVAGTVLERAGSMQQLLDRIPNVTAYDGNIEVFGRGTPEIYINGRKMTDRMELERLSADNIKSVEVITNPGARYSANVKSVIRITTKRVAGEGFGFDARADLKYNNYEQWSETGRFNFNYRKGGFDLTGMLYMTHAENAEEKTFNTHTYLDKEWVQTNEVRGDYERLNPYGKLALNYMFNPNHSVGVNFSYDRYPKQDGIMNLESTVTSNGALTETATSLLTSKEQETTMQANLYYTGKVSDWSIDFNADWYWDKDKAPINTLENYQETGNTPQSQTVDTETRKLSRLMASKLVVGTPLAGGKLEFGGEYSYSARKTTYTVLPADILDDDHSRIEEGMASGFVEYSRGIGPVQLMAGLRYENTDFDYYEDGKYIAEQSRVFNNWFPSVALSANVGGVNLQLGYATDINRPSYWQLRSSILYANRYTYETGNPFLVPEISKNINLGASWKWLSLSAVYSHVSDPILSYSDVYDDDPSKTLMENRNGASYDRLNASLSLQPKVGIWSPSVTLAVRKQWYDMETHEGRSLSNPVGTFRFNNTFDTKWVLFSILMNAQTRGDMENMTLRKGTFRMDLSFYRAFLKNRLSLQLNVRDLFLGDKQRLAIYSGPTHSIYYEQKARRDILFTVRYKFNTTRSKYKGSGAGQSQLQRM